MVNHVVVHRRQPDDGRRGAAKEVHGMGSSTRIEFRLDAKSALCRASILLIAEQSCNAAVKGARYESASFGRGSTGYRSRLA
jgi:hypothetical protein